ncbi:cobyrinate a,c-diamide synthase [Heliorestis acidaminivorans]|uniref:Cobyrinate a,c-diamide synthase n=1 Tax=Heliorestis acidaminivorans TaxID=553427 RepID=A0A6I0F378_9FIRM|nr:cobyrinate a,c-diamide synthase [Heliorestis acidaminivorans]KAB2954190.1 cobyrinate a,c-diamide synthase [Heliorestis acidaminivorans]
MIPSAMIAGTHSGVGKTTLTMGLLTAFCQRGKIVQSFKCGPDYIDPTFYRWITGRSCSNLDSWLMDRPTIERLYKRALEGADLALLEGVMGLYDGAAGEKPGGAGSSASLAKMLQVPIILVVDGSSAAQSVAATVYGFAKLMPDIKILGIIVNRVGSERHGLMIQKAIEESCCLPVFGWLLKNSIEAIPERHLGLVSAVRDDEALQEYCTQLAQVIENQIDIDQIISLLSKSTKKSTLRTLEIEEKEKLEILEKIPVAIARDEAFHFYYEDALRDLSDRGIEWIPFKPVAGETFPAHVKGVYLGGGYPELYLEELTKNQQFIKDLRSAYQNGMPIYGECGGYMFLSRSIEDSKQKEYSLTGLVPAKCKMQKRRQALGYVTAQATTDNLLAHQGDLLRGHEFHYSSLNYDPAELQKSAFRITKTFLPGQEPLVRQVGYVEKALTASYVHFHLSAYPTAMDRLVSFFAGQKI